MSTTVMPSSCYRTLASKIAIISGREVPAVEQRARYLGIKEIYLGHIDKARFAAELCRTRGLQTRAGRSLRR